MTKEYEDFLAHYGIKGMKWGRRRFQNEDGTLTEEGKQRRALKPESDTWKKNESKTLSDDELRRRNNRMSAEAQYRQNIENRHPISKETKAALKKIFVYTAIGVAAGVMALKYKNLITKGESFVNAKKNAKKNAAHAADEAAREFAKKSAKAFGYKWNG